MRTSASARGLLILVLMCVWPSPFRSVAAQAQGVRTVLTIHTSAENFPGNPVLDAGIRESLRSRPDLLIDDFAEYLESDLFPRQEATVAFKDYLHRKYQGRRIDLVIADTDGALRFALDWRAELFPDAPIVFEGLEVPDDGIRRGGAGVTGIKLGLSYAATLQLALALHPSTERVFVVARSESDARTTELVHNQFRNFQTRVKLSFIAEPTLARLLAAVKAVPSGSLIIYVFHGQVEAGHIVYPDEAAPLVVRAANVPVYGTSDLFIGSGIIGGVSRDTRETGVQLGAMAVRILAGTRAQDIPIEPMRLVSVFDWRAMQRWGIDERRLPPGSTVLFRGPSLWRDYKGDVLSVLGVLIVQSVLIAGLLHQRRARRRAEVESWRNLGLAADANRRVTMSALAGSIAHDLSQPLNAILHNAQAGEMLITANRGTPEMLGEILSDIRTANQRATQIIERHRGMLKTRELDKRRIDIHAVVRESVGLVAHDTRARQIQLDVNLPAEPCVVVGDQVLLQQVFVNLLVNAMDAMAEAPPDRRRLKVYDEMTQAGVEVSVRDAGTGLPETVNGRLFEPFVTTKASGIGIGLTIARTIVEAHQGRMNAHNNADGGATFTVTLPLSGSSVGE